MPLLPWMKNKDDETKLEVNLPDETQKKLDAALGMGDDLKKMREQLDGLKSIQMYVEEQRKEREAAAQAAQRKAQAEQSSQTDEELQQLILTDPGLAIKKGTQDQSMAILMLRADQIKRDVFEDADRFPFYTGEVKGEIDKLLAGQTIQLRNDPSVVENCYYTVVGRHAEEAREGKLKTRFASASGARGNAANGAPEKGEHEKLEINDDIKKAARIAGMTPEDYAKMCYDQGVGYV